MPLVKFYDPLSGNLSRGLCNEPMHRRWFNLRKFHNSINGDTSSNRVMHRRRRANGQLLCRAIVRPTDNGRWILQRMGDMEALILLSRRVHYSVEMPTRVCAPWRRAAYTHARTHCPHVPRRLHRPRPSREAIECAPRSSRPSASIAPASLVYRAID